MLIGDNAGSAQMVMADQPAQRGTVVLHIGMHKTASSYIQRRLRKNRALLKANGLLMPKRRQEDSVEKQDTGAKKAKSKAAPAKKLRPA